VVRNVLDSISREN